MKKYLLILLAIFVLGATMSGCYVERYHHPHYYHHW
jgi:hypothetical protein